MTTFIIAITILTVAIGICVASWSIIDTRKKYYDDYVTRKRKK